MVLVMMQAAETSQKGAMAGPLIHRESFYDSIFLTWCRLVLTVNFMVRANLSPKGLIQGG
jgi:hypothetical protein